MFASTNIVDIFQLAVCFSDPHRVIAQLPPVERAELVESLLSSFEFRSRKTIDALWAQEAEDRIDAFERGEMAAIPVERVPKCPSFLRDSGVNDV